jgi:16S rRNA (cytidine1402-2'-O)-methyltransferase
MERAREPSNRTAGHGATAAGGTAAGGPAAGGTPATLTLAAAPIGRPEDASPRLAAALAVATIVAAEDTRRVRRLAAALGVRLTGSLVSYFDSVEAARVPGLLAELEAGRDVLLVTDAGLPGISDPGYRLVAAAAAAGIRVTVLPGPSAVTAALAVSGLPSDRFCFEGFPPRQAGGRARRFAELAGEPRTLIFFESPRRLAASLAAMAGALGPERPAVVCRELTKTHEEVRRGTLGELAAWAAGGALGEITIVVAGSPARKRRTAGGGESAARTRSQAAGPGTQPTSPPVPGATVAAQVAELEQAGTPRKAAIAGVARELGLRKREVYDAVVRHGSGSR